MAYNQKQPVIKRKNKEYSSINLNETKKDRKSDYYPKNSVERSEVLNINLLLSKIFSYSSFNDLIEYNVVCKNWNQLTNPIIHQSIKLLRGREILDSIYGYNLDNSSLISEIEECISNNEKHAFSIKEFTLSNQIQSLKLVNFFEAFSYIENLTLYRVKMNQDIFLCIINPLTRLRELKLDSFNVYYTSNTHNFPQTTQLPSSLTRIAISNICIDNNPELFIQTINSHRNLADFNFKGINLDDFLQPFHTLYPSLKIFECRMEHMIENIENLYNIFEFIPNLVILNLELQNWEAVLIRNINRNLRDLQEFNFESEFQLSAPLDSIFCFFQPSKIIKLKLSPQFLTSNSLNSVLINCPDLDELKLIYNSYYAIADNYTLNVSIPINISKLYINFICMADASLNSILISCANLKVLNIKLPMKWLDWVNIIKKRCTKLMQLTLSMTGIIKREQYVLYEALSNNCGFNNTLMNLVLEGINLRYAVPENFVNFAKLKSIIYIALPKYDIEIFKENEAEYGKWSNFEARIVEEHSSYYSFKLVKLTT